MKMRRKLLAIAGITLGGIGVLVCSAAISLLWVTSARLEREAESLLEKTDHSLDVIRQRVVYLQERVEAAAIATEDLEQSLRDWTIQATVRRIATQADVCEKVERLASTLQEVEQWLEISEASVGIIQNMLSIGAATRAQADTSSVDQVMDEVVTLRAQLVKATEAVATIQEYIAKIGDEKTRDERLLQGARFAVRLVATFSSASIRLEKVADRLSETQIQILDLKVKTRRWFVIATIGITLFIAWMGTGQIALSLLGWSRWRVS